MSWSSLIVARSMVILYIEDVDLNDLLLDAWMPLSVILYIEDVDLNILEDQKEKQPKGHPLH